ncbi:MAG: hypothetical protein WC359_13535 [Dehalococcoidia bacterium]
MRDYPKLNYEQQYGRNLDGKPFSMFNEVMCEATICGLSTITKGSITLATIPAGKEFHFRFINIGGYPVKRSKFLFKYGTVVGSAGSFRLGVTVPSMSSWTPGPNVFMNNIKGMVAKGVVSVIKNTVSTCVITIGGLLIPSDPGF